MRSALATLLAAAALAAGCLHPAGPPRAIPDCPGDWAPTQAIAGDFRLRQSVVVTRGDRALALHLVAQKRGDELLLVGLHPLGAKLFTLRQRGIETSVDALPAPALEVPPLNVLRDLHRARFLGVSAAGADGRFEERRGDVLIVELREAGRPTRRSFRRISGDPEGVVELHFAEPDGRERVTVENGWCGYRAEITTLSLEGGP